MYNCPDNSLVQDIAKAINGEFSAISCYEQLALLAPTQEERTIITEIRQDEAKHFRVFSQIYTAITGMQPTPKIIESCPRNYRDGIIFAFKDEQEAVDFYLEISDKAADPYIKEQFRRAAADEQQHAVWFSFFYTRLK